MVAHIGSITYGYAAGKLLRTPGTLWELTIDYPGMLLAAAGALWLVLMVVTSIKAARRKIRYESWHLLHLYAYLGVGLALPHQLWTGQEFLTSTAKPSSGGGGGSRRSPLLIWWVALPLLRSARYGIRVLSVVPEGDDVVSVYLAGRPGAKIDVEAGQFFTFRFLNGKGRTRAHPYSLSAAPTGESLRITAKVLGGGGSAALRTPQPGTRVLVEGPYGRLSARARTRPRVALIGAGVGVTPLRALAEALPYAPRDAVLLYRFTGRPLFELELRTLAAQCGLQVVMLPGHRRAAGSWLGAGIGPADDVTALKHWVPDVRRPRRLRLRAGALGAGCPPHHRGGRAPGRASPCRKLWVVTNDETHCPVHDDDAHDPGVALRLPHVDVFASRRRGELGRRTCSCRGVEHGSFGH